MSPTKKVTGIHYSNYVRGPHFSALLMDKLYEWYAAYYEFSHLLKSPDSVMEFKVQSGQMTVANNCRLLHGRNAFELQGDESRSIEVCFTDWDAIRSKARVLMKKFAPS